MRYIHKNYSNRKIHIGLVAYCKKGDKYGILYGFRKPKYNGVKTIFENKLFYFEKNIEYEIPAYSLVSYLSYDYDNFSPIVEYVLPLSSIVKVHNERRTRREDDIYHDDDTWQLINEGKPYFDYSKGRMYEICYPMIENDVCTIWSGLFGIGIYMDVEAEIYEMDQEIKNLNYSGWPSFEETNEVISRLRKYINSINAFEIIESFEIIKECSYHSRPGKDDYYLEYLVQNIPSDDKYLSFLLQENRELIFHDNNAYRSDGYVSGSFLQEEETTRAREKAKAEYTKEKHLSFLIHSYFSEVEHKRKRTEELISLIYKEYDVQNAHTIISNFDGNMTDELISLIDKYNRSTAIAPL